MADNKTYCRYHIETKRAPNIARHPHRFQVKINKLALAKLLLKELLHYRGKLRVISSRPCVYGVFSGPFGGFSPREQLCVGCLRCTTQYPEIAQILRNPERALLGDDYFTSDLVDTITYEAETGHIPIKGAGYRGKFGGKEWDSMWTDMSEIVRPTRDGIHGREFISTEVDIGTKPPFLNFDSLQPQQIITLPLPLLFDILPSSQTSNKTAWSILSEASQDLQTFAFVPIETLLQYSLKGHHLIPLVTLHNFNRLHSLPFKHSHVAMDGWNDLLFQKIQASFPDNLITLRTHADDGNLLTYYQKGIRIFHLVANYHGKGKSGDFILDLIRKAHLTFVEAGCRDAVTLLGSGGIVAAEHVPKAIICGLDAVVLDTSPLAALQAKFIGNCYSQTENLFELPQALTIEWGKQRLKNLAGSWRDQLLEILGAMGLREVRRLRGEMGRAMFQKDLENEAFIGIAGYEPS